MEALTEEVIQSGELKVDNIIEIQYIIKAIHESGMTEKDKQSCGACLFCLIELSNKFIKANADIKKLYKDKELQEEEQSSSEDSDYDVKSVSDEELSPVSEKSIEDEDPHN